MRCGGLPKPHRLSNMDMFAIHDINRVFGSYRLIVNASSLPNSFSRSNLQRIDGPALKITGGWPSGSTAAPAVNHPFLSSLSET